MDIVSIILYLLFGAVAGWLAGKLMKGGGFGLIVNIIVGIIGGFIGGWLMSLVGIQKGAHRCRHRRMCAARCDFLVQEEVRTSPLTWL